MNDFYCALAALGLTPRGALLVMERVSYCTAGRPLERTPLYLQARELRVALNGRGLLRISTAITKAVTAPPHRALLDAGTRPRPAPSGGCRLVSLMLRYEEDGDRRFGDAVFDAGVLFDEAGAYLLGRDLRALCAAEDEVEVVERFLRHVTDQDFRLPPALARLAGIRDDDPDTAFARLAGALASGFRRA